MTTQLQLRRGTTAEHSAFTGAEGEITVDTTKDTVVVHDGAIAGGHPLAKEIINDTPSSASDTGIAGTIVWDASYIYVCIATNTWKRAGISTWT